MKTYVDRHRFIISHLATYFLEDALIYDVFRGFSGSVCRHRKVGYYRKLGAKAVHTKAQILYIDI